MIKTNKKGVELTLQTIAVAILILLVIGVVAWIFTTQMKARQAGFSALGSEAEKKAQEALEKLKIGEQPQQQEQAQQQPSQGSTS